MASFVVYELRSDFWQAWNQSLHKVWETTMNTQRRCGRVSKITENWLNTAVFGNMEHYNKSNVAPTESHKMSEHCIFLLQPFEHQQICKPTQKTGYLRSAYSEVNACFEWCTQPYQKLQNIKNKSPIRLNKTPYCQEPPPPQPIGVPSHTTMEIYVLITMKHYFSNIFHVEIWLEPCFVRFDKYSPFDFTALFSDASAVSV